MFQWHNEPIHFIQNFGLESFKEGSLHQLISKPCFFFKFFLIVFAICLAFSMDFKNVKEQLKPPIEVVNKKVLRYFVYHQLLRFELELLGVRVTPSRRAALPNYEILVHCKANKSDNLQFSLEKNFEFLNQNQCLH